MSAVLPWMKRKNPVRIAILGDLILDEYLEGKVSRISPEAPVPVHLVTQSYFRAGGSANTALNVQLAGGEAVIFGVCGVDESGKQLKKILSDSGIKCEHIQALKDRPTIRKTRVVANRQQIVRVDWEKLLPISDDVQDKIIQLVKRESYDGLLISDYGKGGLTAQFVQNIIEICATKKVPVIIDPKGKDYARYTGAFLITPNRNEACDALGIDPRDASDRVTLAQQLQEKFGLRNILLTLGAEGMLFYPEASSGQKPIYLPAKAIEVFDVSGAGDTVAAISSLAIGAQCPISEAISLANLAASKVVGKWGTQPIYRHELEELLNEKAAFFGSSAKIKSRTELIEAIRKLKEQGQKVVFTNGCFDLLHSGHVSYLEQARRRGNCLIVAVNSDRSVRKLKGKTRPIIDAAQRMSVIAALSCVDFVVEFDEDTPAKIISELVPDVLIKGNDYQKDQIVGGDTVTKAGGMVETIELVPGISSSEIMRRIINGESGYR